MNNFFTNIHEMLAKQDISIVVSSHGKTKISVLVRPLGSVKIAKPIRLIISLAKVNSYFKSGDNRKVNSLI